MELDNLGKVVQGSSGDALDERPVTFSTEN